MVGYLLELPVVFAKKKKPSTMENMLVTSVYSFTKQRSYDVCVSKDFLVPGDQVLFIDDFLANGNAAKGIMDLVKQAGAELVGIDVYKRQISRTARWYCPYRLPKLYFLICNYEYHPITRRDYRRSRYRLSDGRQKSRRPEDSGRSRRRA